MEDGDHPQVVGRRERPRRSVRAKIDISQPDADAEGRDMTIVGASAGHCRICQTEVRSFGRPLKLRVTQQYLIGQFSVLLEGLQPPTEDPLADFVSDLRREVESSPLSMLPELAHEAMSLSDTICWDALERGDSSGFGRYVRAALALGEFTDSAGLTSA